MGTTSVMEVTVPYVRAKRRGDRKYYYLVESRREGKKVRQHVLRYIGTQRPTKEQQQAIIWEVTKRESGSNSSREEGVPVVTCFLEHGGEISLFRRSQRVSTYKGRWAGISGYIEPGNVPFEQALEEVREETGLHEGDIELVKEGQPLEVIDEQLGRKWIVHPYRFRVLEPEKIAVDWEHTEVKWIDPRDIGKYETVPKLVETWERVA